MCDVHLYTVGCIDFQLFVYKFQIGRLPATSTHHKKRKRLVLLPKILRIQKKIFTMTLNEYKTVSFKL